MWKKQQICTIVFWRSDINQGSLIPGYSISHWRSKSGPSRIPGRNAATYTAKYMVRCYADFTSVDGRQHFVPIMITNCRSQWPRDLRRRSAAARLLGSWVRIPPGAWVFVCCECCVLSGRGLCDELITRPEESYRLWNEAAMTWVGSQRHRKKNLLINFWICNFV